METECSLLHSREQTTCPYSEPDQSIPCPYPTYSRSTLILSSILRLGLPSGLFPSGLPTKILQEPVISPIRATCPAHLIIVYLIIVNLDLQAPPYVVYSTSVLPRRSWAQNASSRPYSRTPSGYIRP
jgi:hypothetical protein